MQFSTSPAPKDIQKYISRNAARVILDVCSPATHQFPRQFGEEKDRSQSVCDQNHMPATQEMQVGPSIYNLNLQTFVPCIILGFQPKNVVKTNPAYRIPRKLQLIVTCRLLPISTWLIVAYMFCNARAKGVGIIQLHQELFRLHFPGEMDYLVVPFLLHKLQLSCDTCRGSRSCK